MKFSPLSIAALAASALLAAAPAAAQDPAVIVTLAGQDIALPIATQKSYNAEEDEDMLRPLQLSQGGRNVTLDGNIARALQFPNAITILPSTTLEFDFTLMDEEEIHALCVDYNTDQNGNQCFVTGGQEVTAWTRINPDSTNAPTSHQAIGETRKYSINIGQFFTGSKKFKYLAYLQDNDSLDRGTGHSSFANVVLDGYGDDLTIDDHGTSTALSMAFQYSLSEEQDTLSTPAIVDAGESSIRLEGKIWRAAPLATPVVIGENDNLEFDFTLTEGTGRHEICILSLNGGAIYDVWDGIEGGSIYDLTRNERYPNNPSSTLALSGLLEAPSYPYPDERYNFGSRIRTYITAPETGNYTFWIASDDQGELWLSTDETPDNKVKIAYVSGWTSARQWDKEEEGNQKSAAISLVEGQTYYLEALHKQSWGGEHLAIAWSVPSQAVEPSVIDGQYFSMGTTDEDESLKQPTCTDCSNFCFYLGGSETAGNHLNVINPNYVPGASSTADADGTPLHYSIPIGLLQAYTGGKIDAIGFMQDGAEGLGNSTFANIAVTTVSRPSLEINLNGATTPIESGSQVSASPHGADEDTPSHFLEVSDTDPASLILKGNTHKALKLPDPIEVTKATELSFKFSIQEEASVHAICLMDPDFNTIGRSEWWGLHDGCVYLGGTHDPNHVHYHKEGEYYLKDGDSYNIRFGLKATGTVEYVMFMQDAEGASGYSTFSDIEIYDRPSLIVDIDGTETPLFNHQLQYHHGQDFATNLMDVSADGFHVTMSGNLHKALAFPETVTITDKTVLSFTVNVEEDLEIVAICLENNLQHDTERTSARCFKVAGYQTDHLGELIYKGIKHTHESETVEYLIRLSDFFTGYVDYLAFQHDNDSLTDRYFGVTTISDIKLYEMEPSCLTKNFDFTVDECTVDTFLDAVSTECNTDTPMEELLSHFDVQTDVEVAAKIGSICASAHAPHMVQYSALMEKEDQFINEFFDGGTTWNYADSTPKDVAKTDVVSANIDNMLIGVGFPDVHNFHGCKLRAAMCCYVAKRDADYEPEDNSDACYMDFSRSRQSSHVRDGYSIYGDRSEGPLTCHGFAWGKDPGSGDAAFRGNTLFEVAMNHGLHDEDDVEELPGAPLCGCVEKMPVVTRADCTKTDVTQTFVVSYDSASETFSALASVGSVTHSDCGDLSGYYQTLVDDGKATQSEKNALDKYLAGDNCAGVLTSFLETKGFVYPTTM